MRSQAQVIIGSEIDNPLAVESADGGLIVIEHAESEIRALGFEIAQLVAEVRKRISTGGDRRHKKSPVEPT